MSWAYLDHRGSERVWRNFDAASSAALEAAFADPSIPGATLTPVPGKAYAIDFSQMVQRNLQTGFERHVRRDAADAAEGWEWSDHGQWKDFDPAAAGQLSAARRAGRAQTVIHLLLPVGVHTYHIDLARMEQTNAHTHMKRQIHAGGAAPPAGGGSALPTPIFGAGGGGSAGAQLAAGVQRLVGRAFGGGGGAAALPSLPLRRTFAAAAALDGAALGAATGWTTLAPGSWAAGATDPIMCTDLGEDGEAVVRLPCHSEAIPCTFNLSTLEQAFRSSHKCPSCGQPYRLPGPQPSGTMAAERDHRDCEGHPGAGTLVVHYDFPPGVQGERQPQPGQPYSGTRRTCYLPADATGARCLQLLMRAFDQGVAFRVGSSTTTGKENTVVWSIHQKTRYNGGEVHHGWPDPGYVDRLTSECAANNVSVD